MPKYIKITRSDTDGSYIVTKRGAMSVIDAEFDMMEYDKPGTTVALTVVEMPEHEFANLKEFDGW